MKFNLKNKRVIGGLFTILLLGFGVPNYELVAGAATNITCSVVVKCDA